MSALENTEYGADVPHTMDGGRADGPALELATTEERTLAGAVTKVTMVDGTSFTVRITNRDYVAWDRTAPRKKWGKAEDVPFLAATFMAYTAARREGRTTLPFDQPGVENWCDSVDEVDSRADDEDGPDVARPTQKGPEGV